MAARRRNHKTRDLPPNLYARDGYYSYRDPRTGKEYGLGRDKRTALNEAIEAILSLLHEKPVTRLVDRINGENSILFNELIDNFRKEIAGREFKKATTVRISNRLKMIAEHFCGLPADAVDVKSVYSFLENKAGEGKIAIANQLRALLSDIYKSAIARGQVTFNPAEATRPFRQKVQRARLTAEEYTAIRKLADTTFPWFGHCLDLAVITGQRAGDLAAMRWSDIREGKLHIVQEKTGMMLRISSETELKSLNLKLSDVLSSQEKLNGQSDRILGGKSVQSISRAFKNIRNKTGSTWQTSPPSFHEVRSISGRLWTKERGTEFAQHILGHKSSAMTDKYRDGRGREWKEIE